MIDKIMMLCIIVIYTSLILWFLMQGDIHQVAFLIGVLITFYNDIKESFENNEND